MVESVTLVLRGVLAVALILVALQSAETLTITSKPANPTKVVIGVNNIRLPLVWNYSLEVNETILTVAFKRQKPGESQSIGIAKRDDKSPFTLARREYSVEYLAILPATLLLLDASNNDGYTYTIEISYTKGVRSSLERDDVPIKVFVPPKIKVNPARESIIDVGKNLTLTCRGYGNPTPTITWTKDGVSQRQFKVSGNELRLVNVQRKDVGSYRCTASNGYGNDTVRVSIVGLSCKVNQCKSERVIIRLRSEIWNAKLSDSNSNEFEMLELNLLSAISVVYASDDKRLLHRMTVEKFSPGSVLATVELLFDRSSLDNNLLGRLSREIEDEKLGPFTVDRFLYSSNPGDSTLTCNSCGGDAGSGDDVALCNSQQISQPCSARHFSNVGITHCYTLAGRYKFLNGSQVIHTGIARGCINCTDKKSACAAYITAFNAQFKNSIQMLDCNIKCCTGNDCNNQSVSVIPLSTTPPSFKSTKSDANWKKQRTTLHAVYSSLIAVLAMVIIVLVVILWRLRRSMKGPSKDIGFSQHQNGKLKQSKDQETTLQMSAAYVNTADDVMLADENISRLPPLPPDEIELDAGQQSIYETCDYKEPAPASSNWEVSREFVHIVKDIGKGAFSQVAKAEAWNICGIKGLTTVAVKMLKENAPASDRKDLLSELELMKQLKPHPHVIKLMGCVTKSDPLLVFIEYIPYGDLLGYLRKSRGLNDTYFNDPDVKPSTNLTSQQLMQFAWQIADGMNYLSSSKIIHRDLAARNVLVGEGEKCKVTDFGMARNVHQDNIYTKQSRGRLPVKWTAYEALLYGTYTTQSDVWSFGVVLYEIFTIGGSPYPGINGREIANKLQRGYRMPKPKHVDQQLYQLMLQCWQQKPNDRPTFSMLKDKITKLVENNNETYVNMQEYDTSEYGYIDDLLE